MRCHVPRCRVLAFQTLGLLILSGTLWTPLLALAQAPGVINFQSVLLDVDGNPLNAVFDDAIEISIWSHASSPDPAFEIYRELLDHVDVVDGLFEVAIGEANGPLSASVFAGRNRWLEISIDGEVLTPRQPFTAVAYAYQADQCLDALTLEGVSLTNVIDQARSGLVSTGTHGAHTSKDGAHHTKTATFAELSGSASDAQIPATIARDAEVWALVLANDGPGTGLNADRLDGYSSPSFLRSDASDRYTSGKLVFNSGTELEVNGTLDIQNGAGTASSIEFDGGVGRLAWDSGTFGMNGGLETQGALRVGSLTDVEAHNHFGTSSTAQPTSNDMSNQGDVFVQNDVEVGGELYLKSRLYMDASTGADRDQSIYFRNAGSRTAEYLRWNDVEGRFDLSAPLRVGGHLTVTGVVDLPDNSIDEDELAPSVTNMLPIAFGNVYSAWGEGETYHYHTTGGVVVGASGGVMTLSAPAGCNTYSDCMLMVTQGTDAYKQVPQGINQLTSSNRFVVRLRGLPNGDTISMPAGAFNFNFVIYRFP